MGRFARVVVPGIPHHVTQRGNRRLEIFFGDDDYRAYLALLAEHCPAAGVAVWAYCLMPNHVHLILVPEDEDGLRRALGEAHRRYTRRVNFREGWRGHLWQERFHSFAMDEGYLVAAARYVELNPVRAKLKRRARDWRWSSARAHLKGRDDGLVRVAPLLERVGGRLAGLPGRRPCGGRPGGAAPPHPHRPAARRPGLPRGAGGPPRPRPQTRQTGPQAERRRRWREISILSLEFDRMLTLPAGDQLS